MRRRIKRTIRDDLSLFWRLTPRHLLRQFRGSEHKAVRAIGPAIDKQGRLYVMGIEAKEPAPGPEWEPFHEFRLPFAVAALPEPRRQAIANVLDNVCSTLSDLSFDFRFDEDGTLSYRSRASPGGSLEGLSPTRVYLVLQRACGEIVKNSTPPSFADFIHDIPNVIDTPRESIGRWLLQVVGIARAQSTDTSRDVAARWKLEAQHIERQFLKLREWLQEHVLDETA